MFLEYRGLFRRLYSGQGSVSSVVCTADKAPSSFEVEIYTSFISLCLTARTRTCSFYEEIFEKLKSSYIAEIMSLLD